MDGGPPRPEDDRPRRARARRAAWCASAGVILATAAVICLALNAISPQQAIALGLPGALLILGGLIALAVPDTTTGDRLGFHAGFQIGSLLTRFRSFFRQDRNGF